MESSLFFGNGGGMYDNLCKNIFFIDIFGSQYSFEIYHTSVNIKNSENVVKSG